MTARTIAAFDVDGTLSTSDCMVPFLLRLGGKRGMLAAAVRRPLATLMAVAGRDRDALKEVVAGGVYRGRSLAAVHAEASSHAADVAARGLRPDTVARLMWHRQQGHTTVLVSASLEDYLHPLAEVLGVDHVIATRVAHDGQRFNGRLQDGNCRAAEKARRLSEWIASTGGGQVTLWAYGDSRGDEEMLAMADHPVWVNGVTITAEPPDER
jgi:phosphatidylglycerophosphatase C